ncbi:MAG: M23 family metallopeptidase [Flavobacteriales bacterium]|nr:M23 family metallopeptidase [Flavobacteriales bacterium]
MTDGNKFRKDIFRSPIDFTISLSGNFGDFRTNHFHSGIDIRTQGTVGKNIYACADGYISRIRISPYGYGNAIYIDHPSGYTTLYGHLRSFNQEIAEYIEQKQYELELNTIDHYLEPNEMPVKSGDVIAKSGNSGSSSGPHLHFEIRESETEHPLNPLFFGFDVPDDVKPEIYGVYIYPLEKWSTINGQMGEQYFTAIKKGNNYGLSEKVAVSGKVGIGLYALDRFKNGKYKHTFNALSMKVNGKTTYQFKYDELVFETLRDVNSHMDHEKKILAKQKVTKCFKDGHSRLEIYDVIEGNGILDIFPDETKTIEIAVVDAELNESVISFNLNGVQNDLREVVREQSVKTLLADQENAYHSESLSIFFPEGRLYRDVQMNIHHNLGKTHTDSYEITPVYEPLKDWYTLKLKYGPVEEELQSKMTIMLKRKCGKIKPLYSTYDNGWISCRTKEFGEYFVGIDTIAPSIEMINKNIEIGKISFNVRDNFDQFEYYEARVDNRWLMLFFDRKVRKFHCDLRDLDLENGEHELEFWVKDAQGNRGTFKRSFSI